MTKQPGVIIGNCCCNQVMLQTQAIAKPRTPSRGSWYHQTSNAFKRFVVSPNLEHLPEVRGITKPRTPSRGSWYHQTSNTFQKFVVSPNLEHLPEVRGITKPRTPSRSSWYHQTSSTLKSTGHLEYFKVYGTPRVLFKVYEARVL